MSKVTSISDQRALPAVDIERVLDVAASMFAEFGFDGVSMREIARESGCHVPSIYYHFTSKDNLYREACAHKLEDTIDIINSRVGDIADHPRARFCELIEAFFDLFTGDRVLMLLMQRDVADAGGQSRRFLSRRQYDHFSALIRKVASDAAGKDIGADTAFAIGALIFGYCELSIVVHESPARKAKLVEAVMRLLIA
jgi:AcrR family transcriptional regulator